MLRRRVARFPRQHGLSMVELMVGVALGMFLVAGAVTMFVTHLSNSRNLLVEARVNQDLRATADVISRDLRRAGNWDNAISGVIAGTTGTTIANPYVGITMTGTSKVEYLFSRDATNTVQDNEQFGFQRAVVSGIGVIQMKVSGAGGGTWQTLTDPTVLDIPANGLTITEVKKTVAVGGACAKVCPPPAGATWTCPTPPTLTLRQYDITLTGTSVADARVTRTLQTRARVRNDQSAGVCPT